MTGGPQLAPAAVHSPFVEQALASVRAVTAEVGSAQVLLLGSGCALRGVVLQVALGETTVVTDLTAEGITPADWLSLASELPSPVPRLVLFELSCLDTHRAALDDRPGSADGTRDGAGRGDLPAEPGAGRGAGGSPAGVDRLAELDAARLAFPTASPEQLARQVDACLQVRRGPHAELRTGLASDVLRRLLARGAFVVLVEAPLHPATRRLFERPIRNELLEQLAPLASDGLMVLTEQQTGPFPPSEFDDLLNLGQVGRARLAGELKRRLRSQLADVAVPAGR